MSTKRPRRRLTKVAKDSVMDNPDLYAVVCKIADVKPLSLSQMIWRDSASLVNHDVVITIAKWMQVDPSEILEESTQGSEITA